MEYSLFAVWMSASLGLFAVLALPIYCARQEPSGPFWKGYLSGGALGAGLGFLLRLGTGMSPEAVAWLIAMPLGGAVWGAYLGVALAGLFTPPLPRQVGTQSGAAVGMGVALLLGALGTWQGAVHEYTPPGGGDGLLGWGFAVLAGATLLMALGGMVGAQVQLWRAGELPRSRRRLSGDLARVAAVALLCPVILALIGEVRGKLEAPRRAREAQERQRAQQFPESDQPLRELESRDPARREGAAQQLGTPGRPGPVDDRAFRGLIKATRDRDPGVRASAARALGNLRQAQIMQQQSSPGRPPRDEARAVDALERLLHDPEPWVRREAVLALGKVGSPRVVALLQEATRDSDPQVRTAAEAMAGQFRRRAGAPAR